MFFLRTQMQLAIIIIKTHQAPANTSLLLSCNKKIILCIGHESRNDTVCGNMGITGKS